MRAHFAPWRPAAALAAVMAAQSGLFTAEQAYAAGYTPDEIKRARAQGDLESVRRGVYAGREHYRTLDETARHQVDVRALLLRCAAPTTVSHESAAVLQALPLLRPDLTRVHVTRPELRTSRIEAGAHHHPGALPATHVTRVDGVAVTEPARTAVDLARALEFADGLAAVDSALRAGVDPEHLRAVLDFCRAWPGARAAGRAVSYADGRAANPGESWSRAVLIETGLAPDELQLEVRDAAGLVGYADFAWPERRTLGEFDGRGKYGLGAPGTDPGDVLWAEKRREDRLRALGWEVVRWTWADLFVAERVAARVRSAFQRARLRGLRGA
jgi:predicted transcriptional regulator of viral defense system